MHVHVIGPNLRDQSKGSFHVHAAGCSDVTRRREYQGPDFANDREVTYDVASQLDVAARIYVDIIAESDNKPEDVVNDFWFAPCVDTLPYESPTVPEADDKPTTHEGPPALPAETIRLYGWVENWTEAQSPVRALLFGQMAQRAVPVTKHYLSDLYHDVHWLDENVNGPAEFHWMTRDYGTNIGPVAVIQENISSREPRVLYHVRLFVERGQWSVTFTELVRVDPPS